MLDYRKEQAAEAAVYWLIQDPTTFDEEGSIEPEVLKRALEKLRERGLEKERVRQHPVYGKMLMAIEATLDLKQE